MASVIMFVAQKGFRDEELFYPKAALEKAGHKVMVASVSRAKAYGSKGGSLMPDLSIHESNPHFFDLIVVVGGPGTATLWEDQELISFLGKANSFGKIMSAICLGPSVLARAGVLVEKKATVYPDGAAITSLKQNGVFYEPKPIVIDGRYITANGPDMAIEFGNALVESLKKK